MVFILGLPEWVILAVTVCVLLYLYASGTRNYWKNQNVPYEPFRLMFGPTLKLFIKPTHLLDDERYKKYGKLFGSFETGHLVLFVADPELVKLVTVKDFPSLPNRRIFTTREPLLDNVMSSAPVEKWRKLRPAVSPAFSTGKLRKMNSLIEDCAVITAEHLKKAASKEVDIDIKHAFSVDVKDMYYSLPQETICAAVSDSIDFENYCCITVETFMEWLNLFFGNYALDVIARCAFATRLDSHSDQTNEFVTKSKEVFNAPLTPQLILFLLVPSITEMLRIRPLNSDLFLFFKRICQGVIKRRQDEQSRHEDFLQLMMDAQEGTLSNVAENASERDNQLFNLGSEVKPDTSFSSNKTLTEDEAMAQCVLFFLVGQETTSAVIAYTLYLLALHPEVQEKLREEADECFRIHGEHPSLDVITKLKYLHCVVSESLRMYPPATRIERTAFDDYVLGDTGIKVRKGQMVVVPIYSLHHDPQYFPDPYKFDPERFNEENLATIQPYTYLPFGAGPRNCIGMRFALQAVKLCVLHTVRNVKVVRTQKTKVPLEFNSGWSFLSAKNITLGIRKRE